ncbi:MAG: HEAT repeat domain-containing protein, partial [Deltaproteobacteria bacterium]
MRKLSSSRSMSTVNSRFGFMFNSSSIKLPQSKITIPWSKSQLFDGFLHKGAGLPRVVGLSGASSPIGGGSQKADETQRLIEALKDPNADVRQNAAEALGELKDPRAVLPLIEALKDGNGGVRQSAAWALGKLKDPRAVLPLLEALKDPNADV